MTKRKRNLWLISALLLAIPACDDSNSGDSLDGCTANQCSDAKTLEICAPDGSTTKQTCDYGCENAKCKDAPSCAADSCIDAQTLEICNADGTTTRRTCDNGCENAKCNDAPAEKCKADVCASAQTLVICNPDGTTTTQKCSYECRNAKCVDAPAEKCKANVCKDAKTLEICNTDGTTTTQKCDYECRNAKCVDAPVEKCKADKCKTAQTLEICNADGTTTTRDCAHGCENNACKASPLIGTACETAEDPTCDGDTMVYCSDATGTAVWTAFACPTGYSCQSYDDQPMCLESCTEEGKTGTICGTSDFLIGSICTRLATGLFYAPDNETGLLNFCENGCRDRHSCAD